MFRKNNREKGFTLSEMLLVVGITLVLLSIGGVAVVRYKKNLKQMEMDQTAKELFIALQNHLTNEKATGNLLDNYNKFEEPSNRDNYFGKIIKKKPSDLIDGDWNEKDYRYIVYNPNSKEMLKESLLKNILPFGAIEDKVRKDGSYIIEYNIKTGTVFSVFYSDEILVDGDEEKLLPGSDFRGKENKKNRSSYKPYSGEKKIHLGYYGGSSIKLPQGKIIKPEIEVINGEKLSVKVTDKNYGKIETVITLEVKGKESKKESLIEVKGKGKEKTLDLDDITTSKGHFSDICSELIPGEDIVIVARAVGKDKLTPFVESKPKLVNSLFNMVKDDTAVISTIRHLENLDTDLSGVSKKITKAKQVKSTQEKATGEDIDYNLFKEATNNKIYKRGSDKLVANESYYGIKNKNLKTFDGCNFSISNIVIKNQNNSGLFRKVEQDLEVKNLVLKNSIISNDKKGDCVNAGCIVGSVESGKITIKNVSTRGEKTAIKIEGEAVAGGLIGKVENASVKLQDSFSVATINLESKKNNNKSLIGGLIGSVSGNDSEILNSYASGRTVKGGEYDKKEGNLSVKGKGKASLGGFIGSAKNITIKNSYSTASVFGDGSSNIRIGGFIGEADQIKIIDSYSTGLVNTNNVSDKKEGSFIGKALNGVTGRNNFVLSGINNKDMPFENDSKLDGKVSKGNEDDIRGNGKNCKKAYPFDKKLDSGMFKLRTVVNETHYGDWPEGKTKITITKEINDLDGLIDRNTLSKNNLYFTLTNMRTKKSSKYYYKDDTKFQENKDGNYSYTCSMSPEDFKNEDTFIINETGENVNNKNCQKRFEIEKNNGNDGGSIAPINGSFRLKMGDDVRIKVKNTYLDYATVVFLEKNYMTGEVKSIKRKKVNVSGKVFVPKDIVPIEKDGKIFTGNWILSDKNGEAKGTYITDAGYKIPNRPAGVKPGEYEIYFLAEYEDLPVVSLEFGVMKDNDFKPIIKGKKYEIKKGEVFNKKINIRDVLTDQYEFVKVLEGDQKITVSKKSIDFNKIKIYKDTTYKIVVKGEEIKYKIKYVFLNSKGETIDSLSYDKDGEKEIEIAGEKYRGAIIDSGIVKYGVKGDFTNVTEKDLDKNLSKGFITPIWNNVQISENTNVYVIYSRKNINVNYNLVGGKSSEGNNIIQRKSFKYGYSYALEKEPTKIGHTFKGWSIRYKDDDGLEQEMEGLKMPGDKILIPSGNLMITANWEEYKKAKYILEFYVQKSSDKPDLPDENKTYNYFESVEQIGDVGKTPNLSNEYKNFGSKLGSKHFIYNANLTLKNLRRVKADGSTIIKVFYDRDIITIKCVYHNDEEAMEAKKYGGSLSSCSESHRKDFKPSLVYRPFDGNWYYHDKNKGEILLTKENEEMLSLKDEDEVCYSGYRRIGITKYYINVPYKDYKRYKDSFTWKKYAHYFWGYYYLDTRVYRGLYGAPFTQQGSDYYKFTWDTTKTWEVPKIFSWLSSSQVYLDTFDIGENNEIIIKAKNKIISPYKVAHYMGDDKNGWNEKVRFTLAKGGLFDHYILGDFFEGFKLKGYSWGKNYPEKNANEGDTIGFKLWGNEPLHIFHERKKYDLTFKNVKNINKKEVPYLYRIKDELPTKEEIKNYNIPDHIDKDYIFDGWYISMDKDSGIVPDSEKMPSHTYVAFAHWRAPKFSVRLHYGENNEKVALIKDISKYEALGEDNKVLKSAQEEKVKDYAFDEWYYGNSKGEASEQIYHSSDIIIKDIDLYAKYNQVKGKKTIKVRYECGTNKEGKKLYFKLDSNGNIMYKTNSNGKKEALTTADKESEESYIEITGFINEKITLIPKIVYGYRPQNENMVVKFIDELDSVTFNYEPVKTWTYKSRYILRHGDNEKILEEDNNETYFMQVVEMAKIFPGFKTIGNKYQEFTKKDNEKYFYYEIDKDYKFNLAGDYTFSSNTYGYAKCNHKEKSVELKERDLLPENVKIDISYYKVGQNRKLKNPPRKKGEYYAVIVVKLDDIDIWEKEVILEIK